MIIHGKNMDVLPKYKANVFDSCVTDAPYGLGEEPDAYKMLRAWLDEGYMEVTGKGFMGKEWDAFVPQPKFWKEIYRVLKPGGYVLCFFGTRTYDWGVMAMRLAGFEIRDQFAWIYGEGMPKGLDVGKKLTEFKGWNTGIKPAFEPIVCARKPISEKTITDNMVKWSTGAYNIGDTRIGNESRFNGPGSKTGVTTITPQNVTGYVGNNVVGRYPTNVLLGHHPDCEFIGINANYEEIYKCHKDCPISHIKFQTGSDSPSRFFYCAKPNPDEREVGVKSWEKKISPNNISGGSETRLDGRPVPKRANNHPTVKPIELMRYLVKLVTPKKGRIIEPFGGSGTTHVSAQMEFMYCDSIEQDEYWCEVGRGRSEAWKAQHSISDFFNQQT